MGYLKDLHGMTLIGKVPEGTCQECATAHAPDLPHNRDSMAYQYKFYDKHGRFPKWKDAMEHCSPEMKELWIEELLKKGVKVE